MYKREVTPEVVRGPEASRWQRNAVDVFGALKVLVFDDVAMWTRVMSPFMVHENICKSQRAVMTP
jgi:hypothetical protein